MLTIDKSKGQIYSNSENAGDIEKALGPVDDSDIICLRSSEKKKINWKDKLFLAPLTTVGNLPFRRICKEFGADVTCSEEVMASSLLESDNQAWALTERHVSEDLYGVQVCGNDPYVMTRCAQVLQEQADIDFVDINMGSPIEAVFSQGCGSGLMLREDALFKIISGMNAVLDLPLTIKSRTGIYNNKNIAHNFVPKFTAAGISMIAVEKKYFLVVVMIWDTIAPPSWKMSKINTFKAQVNKPLAVLHKVNKLHGRSREHRFTIRADWEYIEECAKLSTTTPLFGNGDILSYNDYKEKREKYSTVSGIQFGRGPLIKPWLFTEIKEQRIWDISSSERFDILKKYTNYGLDHWGTDTKGVENTRRFLLEWLSFLYRYIPVGILVNPLQKVNERPPFNQGRDELETLMSSSNCADWIKISEMLLGPVPEGFKFVPKHIALMEGT